MNEYHPTLTNLSEFKELTIKDITKIDSYSLVVFECDQKLLMDQERIYDVSYYDSLSDIFLLDGRLCATLWKNRTLCVIDLNSKEVLLKDDKAYQISPIGSRCLKVMMKIGGGEDKIYDTVRKTYLPSPDDYQFEVALENELYVFKEKNLELGCNFYNNKRMVIHANGEVLLKDIRGWIEYYDHHLIIEKEDSLEIITIYSNLSMTSQECRKTDSIIAKPTYYQGNIRHLVYPLRNLCGFKERYDLLQKARTNGYFDLSQIEYALMEANGKISFLPKSKYQPVIKKT